MKNWALIILLLAFFPGHAQDTLKGHWEAEAAYDFTFYVDGYVRVREFSYEGDRLALGNDLGMKFMNSVSVRLGRTFRNQSSLDLIFEYFIFRGNASPARNVWFNATELDGTQGLSVRESTLYRGEIYWSFPVRIFKGVITTLGTGLIYDGLIFRIRGVVPAASPHNEPKEDFISQALPYPEVGFSIGKIFTGRSSILLDARGTFIPLFKSFFIEGGNMWLNYATFNAMLSYTYSLKTFFLSPAIHYRLIKTYENSDEDTNDFYMGTLGINIAMGWRF